MEFRFIIDGLAVDNVSYGNGLCGIDPLFRSVRNDFAARGIEAIAVHEARKRYRQAVRRSVVSNVHRGGVVGKRSAKYLESRLRATRGVVAARGYAHLNGIFASPVGSRRAVRKYRAVVSGPAIRYGFRAAASIARNRGFFGGTAVSPILNADGELFKRRRPNREYARSICKRVIRVALRSGSVVRTYVYGASFLHDNDDHHALAVYTGIGGRCGLLFRSVVFERGFSPVHRDIFGGNSIFSRGQAAYQNVHFVIIFRKAHGNGIFFRVFDLPFREINYKICATVFVDSVLYGK